MTITNNQVIVELNSLIRSLPLAVTWMSSCNVKTHHGTYAATDVCQCLLNTASVLKDIRRYERGRFDRALPEELTFLSERNQFPLKRLLDTPNSQVEIDHLIKYSRLFVDLDHDIQTSLLKSFMNEYDRYDQKDESRASHFRRMLFALSCLVIIICSTMEVNFGVHWMDDLVS